MLQCFGFGFDILLNENNCDGMALHVMLYSSRRQCLLFLDPCQLMRPLYVLVLYNATLYFDPKVQS